VKLFCDTETTGKVDFRASSLASHQPHIVQLGALLTEDDGVERGVLDVIIKPDGWEVPAEAAAVHGITTEIANRCGIPLICALSVFSNLLACADLLIAHNIDFDVSVLLTAFDRLKKEAGADRIGSVQRFCTMRATTQLCRLPGKFGDFKWPKLNEAHRHLFNEDVQGAHDAMTDVRACKRIFFAVYRKETAAA
jgi:DNA polymerase III subunit epsilon